MLATQQAIMQHCKPNIAAFTFYSLVLSVHICVLRFIVEVTFMLLASEVFLYHVHTQTLQLPQDANTLTA